MGSTLPYTYGADPPGARGDPPLRKVRKVFPEMCICAEHGGFYGICMVGRMEWLLGGQDGACSGTARTKAQYGTLEKV